MSYLRRALPAAVLLLASVAGCAGVGAGVGGSSARMIQTSPDGGIVAIPNNSDCWPFFFRDQANKLMAMKCSGGYEILQEEEVIVGRKVQTNEIIDPNEPIDDPSLVRPANAQKNKVPTVVKLTAKHDQTEYRITFRSTQPMPVVPSRTELPAR
jgi:hypothetical protein